MNAQKTKTEAPKPRQDDAALNCRSASAGSISDTERLDWIEKNYRAAVTRVLPRSVHVGLRKAIDDAMKSNIQG